MPDFLNDLVLLLPRSEKLSEALIVIAGLLVATLLAGPFIGRTLRRFPVPPQNNDTDPAQSDGLARAGRMIGYLERAVIYLMIMMGEPSGIGFLIAAKSVARYEFVSKSRAAAEYVIIGTLASFAWAILVGFATTRFLLATP